MKLRRTITIGFYLLVAALLAYYVSRLDFGALDSIDLHWEILGAALGLGLLQRFVSPLAWVMLVRSLGAKVPIESLAEYTFAYAKAWLGRYVPGRVAMVAARIYFAERLGVSRSVVAVTSAAEIGSILLVGVVVGLLAIGSVAGADQRIATYRPYAYALAAVCALVLAPPMFNAFIRVAYRIARRPLDGQVRIDGRTILLATAGALVLNLLVAATGASIAGAVDPATLAHAPFTGGAYLLAGALGIAFIFTPSGLGAREAIQIPLFSLVTTPERALAIAVLARVIEVVLDVLFYALSALWLRVRAPREA